MADWTRNAVAGIVLAIGLAPALGGAAAIVQDASVVANFTDFQFFNAAGDAVLAADVVTITHSGSFTNAPTLLIGDATGSSSGSALTCNGDPACGSIVSMWPLQVTASGTADPVGPSKASAGGVARGVFDITNNTDSDISFNMFVETDISWSQLRASIPATDLARIDVEAGYEFGGSGVVLATRAFLGDAAGLDIGTCDFDTCNPRIAVNDLVLPAGETRTLIGYASLTILASVTPEAAVPEPAMLPLSATALFVAGFACAVRNRERRTRLIRRTSAC